MEHQEEATGFDRMVWNCRDRLPNRNRRSTRPRSLMTTLREAITNRHVESKA